jgi:phosphatidylserine decarboxylase
LRNGLTRAGSFDRFADVRRYDGVMRQVNVRELDVKYRNIFGRIAGYLPRDRSAVDVHARALRKAALAKRAASGATADWKSPGVAAFARLIDNDGIVRMYVEEMIRQQARGHATVHTVEEMLATLEHIVETAPLYDPDPKKQNFFPMSTLFAYMMMTTAGYAAFRYPPINSAIARLLAEWCRFLDSSRSTDVLNTRKHGWLSPAAYRQYELQEFVIPDKKAPHWGWKSFNAFFHRQIKPEVRPIAKPGDPKVVVSANDGTVYNIARGVRRLDRFWLKGEPYSLQDMLSGHPFVDRFVGGDVFQSFLSGANFHRWHAPISGTVRHTEIVDALTFTEAESAGPDPNAGTLSLGYETATNTRGLVFIDSGDPKLGMVCVIPVGITEISSVTIGVKPGQWVEKGDELGYFSYGGSTLALVFQPGAIRKYIPRNPHGKDPDSGPPIQVNAAIARAH